MYKNFEAECATSTTMAAARQAHTYQTVSHDSIQILLILQIGRNIIHTYMRVLMTSTFLSHQCAESYSKNRGPQNRTVIKNNGKICLQCAAAWHHRRAAAAESSRRPCENLLPWYSAYLISLSKYE